MNAQGYFTVIPNNNKNAIIIKCDYTLTAEDDPQAGTSPETINVTGATAAIPAAYCKWAPNTMYTYIFKISQETNGTTGTGNDPAGLFPITFDAAVIDETESQQGTETIINSPSITTYQEGSVTDKGIEYKTGEDIVITVTDKNGNLQELNNTSTPSISTGYIAVYKLLDKKTEAELTVTSPTGSTETVNFGKVNEDTDQNSTKATFNPSNTGYYAIQYCSDGSKNPKVYKYKVIHVQ